MLIKLNMRVRVDWARVKHNNAKGRKLCSSVTLWHPVFATRGEEREEG
jgi:hypothetical protein